MAADPLIQKYRGGEAFVDSDSGEPVSEAGGCWIEFHAGTKPDDLLTEGGVIEKRHPQVAEIRRMEREALALLRSEDVFAEPEPLVVAEPPPMALPAEPAAPAQNANDAARREHAKEAAAWRSLKAEAEEQYRTAGAAHAASVQAHAEWEERRQEHDNRLKEQAALLKPHHEHDDIWVVQPAGRPIFRDVEMIRIVIPGDKDNIVDREVRPSDIQTYRTQYTRWKEGKTQTMAGTPLAQWPKVTAAQVQELSHFHVHTVEQLAATSDVHIQNIGPFMALRQKARDWIATSRGTAPIEEARAETRRVAEENAELKRQLKDLADVVAEMRGGKAQGQVQQPQRR